MNIILKYKKELLAGFGLVAFYFVTRLAFLGDFPIFTDEAIYVRWTQIALDDASWRFISLTDGKQPSFIWIGMVFLKIFGDPLVSLRLVSVAAGFVTLIGVGVLTYELFKNKLAAFIASLVYLVIPFAVVYDRLALYDSLLGAFTVWGIYLSILLVRKVRLDIAFIFGFILGGALLTKSSGIFNVFLLPFTLLLFNFKDKEWKKSLLKWGILVLFVVLLGQAIFSVIKLSPFAHIISQKNSIFVVGYFELFKDPFLFFTGNIKGLTSWLFTYLNPLLILVIIAFVNFRKYPKEKLLMLLYFILPFLALAFYGKVIFPRFIFFMMLSLIPLISIGFVELIDFADDFFKKRKLKIRYTIAALILLFFLLYPAKTSIDFITNSANATLASADVEQYVKGWPSGGGVKDSIEFFENESRDKEIVIATEGTFGLMPYVYEIFFKDNANIKTIGYWPINEFPEELREMNKEKDVYFVFYQPCPDCEYPGDAPDAWPLRLVKAYEKSENTFLSIYKVEKE